MEIINDTIYGVYCSASSGKNSHLVILNPDLTIKETVGTWNMGEFGSPDYIEQIIDTTVQNGTLWGTYNKSEYDWSYDDEGKLVSTFKSGTSYLIPIDLTTGMADKTKIHQVTGLPESEIIYTIACNAVGQMYAIVADGGETGGTATLYTIDTSSFKATEVGSTGVTTNYISSSTFAPDGTLYWAENNAGKLYTVNTGTGRATAVSGGTIGGGTGTVAVYGGTVTATGGTAAESAYYGGAGIGAGGTSTRCDISIAATLSGGQVTATGGAGTDAGGAGIGAGGTSTQCDISVAAALSGGQVTAQGGSGTSTGAGVDSSLIISPAAGWNIEAKAGENEAAAKALSGSPFAPGTQTDVTAQVQDKAYFATKAQKLPDKEKPAQNTGGTQKQNPKTGV